MDGTIVDTEPYWIAEEVALVAEHGGHWTAEDGLSLVGLALRVSAGILVERTRLPLTPGQVTERLIRGVTRRVATRPPWRPGARELLAEIKAAGVPLGLVTMSYGPLADAVLAALPAQTFDVVVTGDTVTHGKPHPEPYLTAAARLGVPPAATVAIEDSPPGLASAEAAGCRSLGVRAHVPIPPTGGRSRVASLVGVGLATLAAIAGGEVIDRLADGGPVTPRGEYPAGRT
jgi:HAD superfamily hydrolase (TIGR01509 family)